MISTCILSFNHPILTENAIRSALVHMPPQGLAVLHNGSMEKNVLDLQKKFPFVTHWTVQTNQGFSGGVNEIFRHAFAMNPWVLFLSNDCELLTAPRAPALPGFYSVKAWARKIGRVDSTMGCLNFKKAHLRHIKESPQSVLQGQAQYVPSSTALGEAFYVPGSAFLLHRDVFEGVGGFDTTLGTYWEDVDFSMRVQKAGFKLGHFPEVEVVHKIGKTCHKDAYYTTYLFQRNRRIVSRRHCPVHLQNRLRFYFLKENLRQYGALLLRKKWPQLKLFHRAVKDADKINDTRLPK